MTSLFTTITATQSGDDKSSMRIIYIPLVGGGEGSLFVTDKCVHVYKHFHNNKAKIRRISYVTKHVQIWSFGVSNCPVVENVISTVEKEYEHFVRAPSLHTPHTVYSRISMCLLNLKLQSDPYDTKNPKLRHYQTVHPIEL